MTTPKPTRLSRRERRAKEAPQRRQKREQETKLHQQAQELLRQNESAPTYWLGQRCEATRLRVWLTKSVGNAVLVEEAPAVRVRLGDGLIYLDDTSGAGWLKVTAGFGRKHIPHRELDMENLEEIV
jgi:hypothetical protein